MRLNFIISVLIIFFVSHIGFSQDPCENYDVTINFSNPYTTDGSPIEPGSEFCVDFLVEGFIDVATINFIVSFDPSVIELVTMPNDLVTNPTLSGNFEFFSDFVDIGYLSFIWLSPTGSGITVGDIQLFKLTFRAIGEINDCTFLNLVSDPAIGAPPLVGINSNPSQPTIPCDLSLNPIKITIACTSLNVISSSCGSDNNEGIIDFSFCGGDAPYSYEVIEDASSNSIELGSVNANGDNVNITGLSSGTYTINVTDNSGTMFTLVESVSNSSAIDFDLNISKDPICPGSKGTIRIDNLTGGTGNPSNYQIAWSNGTFAIDSINTNEGNYSVSITDESGCMASRSIGLFADTILINNIVIDSSVCGGNDGLISFDVTGGNPDINGNYDLFFNSGFSGTGSSFSVNANAGNNQILIRDGINCVSDTFDLFVPTIGSLLVDIQSDDVLCFGDTTGSINITINDTLGFDFSLSYSVNALLQSPQGDLIEDNQGNPILGGISTNNGSIRYDGTIYPGTFYITLLSDSDCRVDTFITINEPPLLEISKDSIDPDCSVSAGSAIVNVMGGTMPYDYNWDFDPSLNNNEATGLMAGNYAVTVTDANDCSVSESFSLLGGGELNLNIDVLQEVNCDESVLGTVEVTVNSGITVFSAQWFDEMGTLVSVQPIADMLGAGTYTVTVTDDATGCMGSSEVTLETTADFSYTATITNPTCYNTQDGVINIDQPVGGVPPYTFDWADFGPIGPFVPLLGPGNYEVTVTDFTGCNRDTIFEIIAPPVITGTVETTNALCYESCDGTATATPMGGTITTGNYSFEWSSGDTGSTVSGLCPGIYMVTVLDELQCASEEILFEIEKPDSLELIIDQFLTIDLNCAGDATGMIGVQASGGTGDYIYSWTNNISDTNFALDLGEGTYGITVVDENNCSAEASYTLQASEAVTGDLVLSEPIACFGGKTFLCVENVMGGNQSQTSDYTFQVNFDNRISIDSCYEVIAGEYRVDIFDGTGLCSFTTQIDIDQPDQIQIFLGENRSITLGDSNNFISASIQGGAPIESFIWTSDIDEDNFECRDSSCSSIFIYPSNTTEFSLTVIDENGCVADASVLIEVLKERRVYRPNVFNPNSDFGNNRFMIFIGDGAEMIEEFMIFDRWGNQVYFEQNISKSDITPDSGWDGRNSGQEAANGVYVYFAKIRFQDSLEPLIFRGQLTLLR